MNTEILQGCLREDNFYQKRMVEVLAPLLMSTCRRYDSDSNTCNDILQETFIKVFKNIQSFRGDEKSFIPWAHRICVNECINYLNRSKKHKYEPIEHFIEKYSGVEDQYDFEITYLLDLISTLPIQYRTIFNLIAIDGYTHQEVATMLNITEPTSRSNYSRARKNLRLMIQQKETLQNG